MKLMTQVDGHDLVLTSMYVDTTYSGLLCGDPTNVYVQNKILEDTVEQVEKIWGKGRKIVCPPTAEMRKENGWLPKYTVAVWISSDKILKDETANGSHAFLIFCTDDISGLVEKISARTWGVAWDKIAEDFHY